MRIKIKKRIKMGIIGKIKKRIDGKNNRYI